MKIVISSGHGKYISGAVGPSPWGIHEHTEAVKVVNETAAVMRSMGVEVITYEDTVSKSQDENLDRIIAFHNNQGSHDLDVSVHFNSTSPQPSGPVGCEVFYKSSAGKVVAQRTVDKICTASGLKNRGPKTASFAFLNGTDEVAVLVEVCFVNSHADVDIYHDRFYEICTAIAEGLTDEQAGIQPDPGPDPEPPVPPEPPGPDVDSHPTLKKGSQGEAVVRLQRSLGIPADGDFGSITDTQVRAFQAACELVADGIVGPQTWADVDALDMRVHNGDSGLDAQMAESIDRLVVASGLDDYEWKDRGSSYPGYISGMSMCFAIAMNMFVTGKASALHMAKVLGDPAKDAMAWYADDFANENMTNGTSRERIRHLFVLLIGLGMRESSGKYCEGRDMSASNTTADTCEAGLFQSSWNFHNSSMYIEEFFHEYWADPNGFLDVFSEGVYPSANNLNCYGSGDGAAYQWLAKFCPAMAVMTTAIGLRVLKDHWGPIKRHEAELVPEVDDLLEKIQELIEAGGSSETA